MKSRRFSLGLSQTAPVRAQRVGLRRRSGGAFMSPVEVEPPILAVDENKENSQKDPKKQFDFERYSVKDLQAMLADLTSGYEDERKICGQLEESRQKILTDIRDSQERTKFLLKKHQELKAMAQSLGISVG